MKEIPNFSGYFATECGHIYSSKTDKVLKDQKCSNGYLQVTLSMGGKTTTQRIHRLVAAAYYGESDLCVNHIDRDRTNNSPGNLEYVTYSENSLHSPRKSSPLQLSKGGVSMWFPTKKSAYEFIGVSDTALYNMLTSKSKSCRGWVHA